MSRKRYGMTVADYNRMTLWCEQHKESAAVRCWLDDNPPPICWEGTLMQWAYLEMPEL